MTSIDCYSGEQLRAEHGPEPDVRGEAGGAQRPKAASTGRFPDGEGNTRVAEGACLQNHVYA